MHKPRLLFRPHPILGWRLAPDGQVNIGFRPDVTQTTNSDGWRTQPKPNSKARKNLVLYGCSFTYGSALANGETYAALIQNQFPNIVVTNKGVGGYGTVQNYLQFLIDIKNECVDAAIFGVISDHRYRNVPHPNRMRQFQNNDWVELGVEQFPTAYQRRDGTLDIRFVPLRQPALRRENFQDFLPSEFMLDQATFAVFETIETLAARNAIPFVIALLDQIDPEFNGAMDERFSGTLDISNPHTQDYTFMPDDVHPNVSANQAFAQKLFPEIQSKLGLG